MTGGIESENAIIFVIGGAILLKVLYEFIQGEWVIFKQQQILFFYSVINNHFAQLILFFLLGISISYIFYKTYCRIQKRRKKIKERDEKIEEEEKYVREFLKLDLRDSNYEELKSRLNDLKEKDWLEEYPELNSKIKEAKNVLIELKHKKEMINIKDEKISLEEEIEELELKREELRRTENAKKTILKCDLNLEKNRVFDKSNLNRAEMKILLEEGYKQVNEYCVSQKKIITVLIKPILNHSIAHTFLVWSARQLLEEYPEIENIREHETRDADLTFRLRGRYYAIEIETGTLLRKKKQLEEKMKFLNRKYGKRWLIIVSKRDLVKKYNHFGLCTQRKWVSQKLEKLAGI